MLKVDFALGDKIKQGCLVARGFLSKPNFELYRVTEPLSTPFVRSSDASQEEAGRRAC